MAFYNRLGSIMRQTIHQNGSGQIASMLNTIRCMSSSNLFVGGLSFGTDDQSLREAFSGFGDVIEAKVITERDTGRSSAFGFVNFSDAESASSAISAMDGQEMHGRNIRVSYAQETNGPPLGGFGSGVGGFGGGDFRSPVLISFHSSGLTCNQWRKLKNMFSGRIQFRPVKKQFSDGHSAGRTCILYMEESDREFLQPDSMDQDLLLLYGQDRSTFCNHMDVEKAYNLDELETSLFHLYLPSSYLCFVCSEISEYHLKKKGCLEESV